MVMSFDNARRRKTRQGAGELISVSLTSPNDKAPCQYLKKQAPTFKSAGACSF
jgi:hypothetical protein